MIIHVVKCKNGYIAIPEFPDTLKEAHIFTAYADLVEWLYTAFKVSEEIKPA